MKEIYIVNNKKTFIQNLKGLTNIKVMTLKELEDKVLGTYTNEAKTYLNKKIDFNLIDVYLNSFKYINNEKINQKINDLNEIKNELINKNLYFYDEIFLSSLKNAKITFYEFIENKHLTKLINILKKYCEVIVIYKNVPKLEKIIYEYKTLDDELNDVIFKVMELLEKGIDINKIKLMNLNSDYYPSLTRILNQYNIPFCDLYKSSLFSSNYVLNFIQNMNNLGIKDAIKLLNNKEIDPLIINIINDYAYLDNIDEAKEFIIQDLKRKRIPKNKKDNYLELVDSSYDIKEDEYVFFLNFNNSFAPKIYEDSDYITDKEYDLLNELNSNLKTNLKEKELICNLNKCYYISYKLIKIATIFSPTYLISKYNLKVEKVRENHIKNKHYYYSNKAEIYNYSLKRDYYLKTKEKDLEYEKLAYNFQSFVPLKNYSFKGIDKDKLKDYLDGNIRISYSSFNNYFKCPFSYYLDNVLKLNKYENKLSTIKGSVFHKLLEEYKNIDFNYDKVFNEEISSFQETNNKIRFFTSLIKEEFYLVVEFNKNLLESSTLKNIKNEYEINFSEEINGYNVSTKGFIDKIMYNDNSIALIDYKTGDSAEFNLAALYYGIDLQLPFYAYFISKDKDFKNKEVVGLYLQFVFNNLTNSTLEDKDECFKSYKLNGYTNTDRMDVISNDIKNYVNGLSSRNTKNSFNSLIINNIASFTEKKIKEGINGIINANFKISPFKLDKTESCKYCKYSDICFIKNKIKEYPLINPKLFLGKVNDIDFLEEVIIASKNKEFIAKKDELKANIKDNNLLEKEYLNLINDYELTENMKNILTIYQKRKGI